MLPVIYSASSSEFSSNGQGVLIDCLSCRVTEERNGIFEMELTYPSNGQHADKLVVDAIIKATAHKGDEGQLFRIYKIDKNLDGDIVCHCQHISYQLSFIVCSPFTAANVGDAFTALANHMEDQTAGFTFATDKSTVANIKIDVPTTSRSVLGGMEGSILDVYHGEYEFNNFNVKLWNNRGRDNGVVLRYGKNITDINQESNIADTYTGLRPYYYDGDELVELATSEKCVWCNNANSFPYKRVYILDCTSDFSNLTDEYGDRRAPTPAELLAYANSYISNHDFGVPKVTVKVEFEALWDNPEYAEIAMLETVNLCDTVHVEFEALNISVSSKVIKTVYDSLLDRYVSLTVGSATANFTDTVASMNEKTVEYVEDTANALELAQQRATDMLLGVNGGYKVEKRNGDGQIIETLYMDTLSEGTATKIWRWNVNGLGYSPNGAAGPYTVAITKNGEIVADFITTGTLNANLITAGVLKSQENANSPNFYANLATGDVTVKGTVEASAGQIGRYRITSTYLDTGTGNNNAGMGGNQAFWAGNSSSNSAPFRVAYDGTLYASNATISGAITANSLTLGTNASVSASKVTGLASVATSGAYSSLSGTPNLTVYYQKGSTLGTVGSGSNGFTVSTAGLLQASNAVIYGTIYATAGKIGKWSIDSTGIESSSGGYTTRLYPVDSNNVYNSVLLIEVPVSGGHVSAIDLRQSGEAIFGNGHIELNDSHIYAYNGWNTANSYFEATYQGAVTCQSLYAKGSISCGGSKNRNVHTDNYDDRLLYCYETPVPMFGDVGELIIGEDGRCLVYIDDIFSETVDQNVRYQVFLQNNGPGDSYVSQRTKRYFEVVGTPGLSVSWELKASQRGYAGYRLESSVLDSFDTDETDFLTLYGDELSERYVRDLEDVLYETTE